MFRDHFLQVFDLCSWKVDELCMFTDIWYREHLSYEQSFRCYFLKLLLFFPLCDLLSWHNLVIGITLCGTDSSHKTLQNFSLLQQKCEQLLNLQDSIALNSVPGLSFIQQSVQYCCSATLYKQKLPTAHPELNRVPTPTVWRFTLPLWDSSLHWSPLAVLILEQKCCVIEAGCMVR